MDLWVCVCVSVWASHVTAKQIPLLPHMHTQKWYWFRYVQWSWHTLGHSTHTPGCCKHCSWCCVSSSLIVMFSTGHLFCTWWNLQGKTLCLVKPSKIPHPQMASFFVASFVCWMKWASCWKFDIIVWNVWHNSFVWMVDNDMLYFHCQVTTRWWALT